MKKIKILPLIVSLSVCFSAAIIGSFFTSEAIPTWYSTLNKPIFNPPNWVFGPVWSVLYLMMGVSLYIAWQKKANKKVKQKGLIFFFSQLFFNTLWSIIFFGLHSPLLAFLVIIALWILIFLTIKNFLLISRPASYLLIPYLAWVSFASLFNFSIVILNR